MATAAPQREYETIYVLRPDVGRDVTEAVAGRVSDAIKQVGAVSQIENWGRRKLAYPMSKHQRGLYVYFKYLGSGESVSEVERALRLHESVMTFQTVKLSDAAASDANAPQATFQHIEEPDDDEDETFAQTLGLEHAPHPAHSGATHEREGTQQAEDDSAEAESARVDGESSESTSTQQGGQKVDDASGAAKTESEGADE